MAPAQQPVVVGVLASQDDARRAISDLRQAGFGEDQIGMASRHEEAGPAEWEPGAAAGAATGAGIGALWALGIAAGALPPLGPVIVGGLLASLVASAAGGAALGGLVGALVSMGVPEEEALYYDRELRRGRTLITVRAADRQADAREILLRYGAYDLRTAPAAEAVGAGTMT